MIALVYVLLFSNVLLLTLLIALLIDRHDLKATAEVYRLAFYDHMKQHESERKAEQ